MTLDDCVLPRCFLCERNLHLNLYWTITEYEQGHPIETTVRLTDKGGHPHAEVVDQTAGAASSLRTTRPGIGPDLTPGPSDP